MGLVFPGCVSVSYKAKQPLCWTSNISNEFSDIQLLATYGASFTAHLLLSITARCNSALPRFAS